MQLELKRRPREGGAFSLTGEIFQVISSTHHPGSTLLLIQQPFFIIISTKRKALINKNRCKENNKNYQFRGEIEALKMEGNEL